MEDDEDPAPPRILDAPKAIWLNYGDLERDDTHDNLSRAGDVTWCKDKQFDSDVCYVREDVSWLDRLKPKSGAGVGHMLTDDQLTALATLHLAGKNDGDTVQLLPLLRAVVAAERERCAKLCEAWGFARLPDRGGHALANVAAAIRDA